MHVRFSSAFIALMIIVAAANNAVARILISPLPGCPAPVVLSEGGTFNISLKEGYRPMRAALTSPGGATVTDLSLGGPVVDNSAGGNVFALRVPSTVAPGLYSLEVALFDSSRNQTDETALSSVWVLKDTPGKLVFAHISDVHIGDPRASMSKSVETPEERRAKILKAASESGAQFIIATGDIVSIPGNYKAEYPQALDEILKNTSLPVFAAPGNHDLYNTSPSAAKADGLTFWRDTFGPERYSIAIGNYRIIAMDTYDWPAKYRNFMNSKLLNQVGSYMEGAVSVDQAAWLRARLSRSKADKENVIVIAHHPIPSNLAPIIKESPAGLVPPADVAKLLVSENVVAEIAGHIHFNTDMKRDGLRVVTVSSTSAQLPEGEAWGYKLCTLEGAELSCEFKSVVPQQK